MNNKKTLMIISFVVLLLVSSILIYVSLPHTPPKDPEEEDLIVAEDQSYELISTALQSIITDPAQDPLLLATPQERYDLIDFDKRFFRPVFDTKIELYVATLPQKPDTLATNRPQDKPASFSPNRSTYGQTAFIDASTSTIRWFSIVKDDGLTAAKYLWQVGLAPFSGSGGDQLNPKGLLSSGEITSSATEFSIDFSSALTVKSLANRFSLSEDRLKRFYLFSASSLGSIPTQKTYYVRVLPIDAQGKVIGDGGTGMPVLYGDPITLPINNIIIGINTRFDLLSTQEQGAPGGSAEFPNRFNTVYTKNLDPSNLDELYYCFYPQDTPTTATSLVLQVTKTPFSGSIWNTVPGLVYEKRINQGEAAFSPLDNFHWLEVDFSKFAPSFSELGIDKFINYYVRIVALTPTTTPGVMSAKLSKVVTIKYGKETTVTPVIYETIKVQPRIPDMVSFSYTPIQWETPYWQNHYVVIRQPLESEIFMGFGSDKLYAPFTVGTKLDFTPKEDDDSWWDEVKGAISDFFSDVVGYLAKITNWISSTYDSLKTGLIEFVAKNLPLVPDKWRDKLATVLTAFVDYGLASIGIPPTLPDFDDLTSMGTDYIATMAMESAGIPANEIITDGLSTLSSGIINNLSSSANTATPNPMNWDFVKYDPDYLYRPAYVLITLHNPYSEPTPEGTLSGYNQYIINTASKSQAEEILFAAFGGNVYYSTFKIVSNQKVPSLAPGQTLVIPVFLEEMTGKSYWANGPKIDKDHFKMIYNTFGDFDFNFTITYDLPSAYDSAKAQNPNTPKDAIYAYQTTGNSVSFTIYPSAAYSWAK